jgi:hypothetical protein
MTVSAFTRINADRQSVHTLDRWAREDIRRELLEGLSKYLNKEVI